MKDWASNFPCPCRPWASWSPRSHFGADDKHYQAGSANADLFYELITHTSNGQSSVKFGNLLYTMQQPVRQTVVGLFALECRVERFPLHEHFGKPPFSTPRPSFNRADVFSQ